MEGRRLRLALQLLCSRDMRLLLMGVVLGLLVASAIAEYQLQMALAELRTAAHAAPLPSPDPPWITATPRQ